MLYQNFNSSIPRQRVRISNTNQVAKKSVYETVTQVVEESNIRPIRAPHDASEVVETPWEDPAEIKWSPKHKL